MAIEFINSTAGTIGTAASTWSIVPHSSIEGGAAWFVGIGVGSTSVIVSTVTDNAGNVYRLAVRRPNPRPNAGAEIWYATNISTLSTRVSITLSGNSSGSQGIGQFRGVSTGNALGVTETGADGVASTVHACSVVTPTLDNSLVVAFSRANVSTIVPVVHDGGFLAWISTGQAVRTVGGYIIQTSASTATGTWRTQSAGTSTGVSAHAGVIAAFGDTVTPPPPSGGYFESFALMGFQYRSE